MKRLIIAYGNRDREDDGAGWHVLEKITSVFGLRVPEFPGEWVETADGSLRFLYLFQLLPEMAEDICDYDQVIFIDAHNSEQLDDLLLLDAEPTSEHSAFTHHMGAGVLLSIAKTLTGNCPQAKMLTIRGFSFQFKRELSENTAKLVDKAVVLLQKELGLADCGLLPYVEMPTKLFLDTAPGLIDQSKPVIREHSLELIVNGESWLSFICSPCDLNELAVGFLWNENVISEKEQVNEITLTHDLSAIEVTVNGEVTKPTTFHRTSTGTEPQATPVFSTRDNEVEVRLVARELPELYNRFSMEQKMHDFAGGFHTAGLSDGEAVNLVMEDLGRHNCIDKLAGAWLLGEQEFEPLVLMLTGRISSEMVMKSLALGVRFIISRTTPTALAVHMAEEAGICLVGYMRATQFEVYSHSEYLI